MHKEEIDIGGVIDNKGFVARGHHVAGFLIRAESDLWREYTNQSLVFCQLPMHIIIFKTAVKNSGPLLLRIKRTPGITAWPLNRLRTRLSIPFGLRQFEATHMKRSL